MTEFEQAVLQRLDALAAGVAALQPTIDVVVGELRLLTDEVRAMRLEAAAAQRSARYV